MAKPEIKHTQLFINNSFVDAVSRKTFATIDPATEEIICQIAEGDKVDVDTLTILLSVLVLLNDLV